MKNLILYPAIFLCIAASSCKGNGSTSAEGDVSPSDTTKGLNDGNGAPGSGSGSAGAGTRGDTTFTPQDTVHGRLVPHGADTTRH